MHHLTGTDHTGTKRLGQGLMAEADAEDGDLPREAADGGQRDARLVRRAGAGRDHQMAGASLIISSRLSSSLRLTCTS